MGLLKALSKASHVSRDVATFCFAKEYENNWPLFKCQWAPLIGLVEFTRENP